MLKIRLMLVVYILILLFAALVDGDLYFCYLFRCLPMGTVEHMTGSHGMYTVCSRRPCVSKTYDTTQRFGILQEKEQIPCRHVRGPSAGCYS